MSAQFGRLQLVSMGDVDVAELAEGRVTSRSMSVPFELWFDFSCPYAYLALVRTDVLVARTRAPWATRAFSLERVLRALGTDPDAPSAAKAAHAARDVLRYAKSYEIPLAFPSGHPFSTELATKCLLVAPEPSLPLAQAFFRAYWVEGRDISRSEVVREVLEGEGLDAEALLAAAARPEAEAAVAARTEEALAKGLFGAPSFVVGDTLFFGLDRMHLVEEAIGGKPTCPYPQVRQQDLRPVDVWFDFSSPFAYLGVCRAREVLGKAGRLRPMLLGAIFERRGHPMVPLFEFSEPKRRYYAQDLDRQAASMGLPFTFPTRFPLRSVTPLRMALAAQAVAPSEAGGLIERIFRAYWAEGQDVADLEVLAGLAAELGLDGAALAARTSDPAIKDALRASTDEALEAGVFGAPTFVVHRRDGGRSLYWGSDRLHLAAQAAAGHTAVF